MEKFADLHLHTTSSDGNLTPSQVIIAAKEKGFSAVAITDHDTIDGLEEAQKEAAKQQIEFVPGIELSTEFEEKEVHILGYYFDKNAPRLKEKLQLFIESRKNRAEKMVKKLNDLGLDLSLDRVKEIAGTEFMGRPHIARAMLEKGYISELSQAFTRDYIASGGRAYVDRFKFNVQEAVKLLLDIGGIPVLAHPGFLSRGAPLDRKEISRLVGFGVQGIEVYYIKHSEEATRYYRELALKNNLLITGGSDCHGDSSNFLLGSIKLPYNYLKTLQEKTGSTLKRGR